MHKKESISSKWFLEVDSSLLHTMLLHPSKTKASSQLAEKCLFARVSLDYYEFPAIFSFKWHSACKTETQCEHAGFRIAGFSVNSGIIVRMPGKTAVWVIKAVKFNKTTVHFRLTNWTEFCIDFVYLIYKELIWRDFGRGRCSSWPSGLWPIPNPNPTEEWNSVLVCGMALM